MKNIILTACLATFTVSNVFAQTKKWSLDECIQYAIENNIEIKRSNNRVKTLRVQRNTLKSQYLPQIQAGASQKFDYGRALNQDNMYENSNVKSTAFSINAELSLFSGFKTSASIAQNKYDLLAAEADKEEIANNLSLNVAAAYFQVLLSMEIHKIAEAQVTLTKEQIVKTELLIENGKVPRSHLYEVKAQLADDELAVTEAENKLQMATLELKQLMELEEDGNIELEGIVDEVSAIGTINPIHIYNAAECCMPQIRKANYTLESKAKSIKIAQANYYPTVNLGAGISTGYYDSGMGIGESFRNQINQNMQKSIYVSISIPLFDRFNTRNQVKTARIEKEQARLSLDEEKKKLYKEINKAYTDVLAAYEKYQSTCKSVSANKEAYRFALEKYEAGKSTVFEFNEMKMKMADAQSKQSQAKYTYLLKGRILNFYACHALMN